MAIRWTGFYNLGKYVFLYVPMDDGERILSDLLANGWNARRGNANMIDSSLHVLILWTTLDSGLHVFDFVNNTRFWFACF